MVVNWHDGALVLAGMIGSGVAIVHGVLVQLRMIEPLRDLAATRMSRSLRILVAIPDGFSTPSRSFSLPIASAWLAAEVDTDPHGRKT
jgi:hypothetical protein